MSHNNAINLLNINPVGEDICTICQYNLGDKSNIYRLPECHHDFHTNCIVTWFRCGQNSCPLCGNKGINNGEGEDNPTHVARGTYWG